MRDDQWDRLIAEQAAYYGLPVERFTRLMHNMAELQEQAEQEEWKGDSVTLERKGDNSE